MLCKGMIINYQNMYCDIMCHKLWIMVVKYYFRTWYDQVAKKNICHCYFSFKIKYSMIIEDMSFLFCCCILDNSEIIVLNLLITSTTYIWRLNDERSVTKTLNVT